MKIITTEVLISWQMEVPVITRGYDPLSRRYDGVITSQAPIIVSGRHLDMLDLGNIRLYLASAVDYEHVIEVLYVYKYTQSGDCQPAYPDAGRVLSGSESNKRKSEDSIYIFPVSWVVMPEGYERGGYYPCCTETGK